MSWNWARLRDVVSRLKLPADEYAVGRVGYGLSRDPSSTADRVELLVTEAGWRSLKERGWREARGRRTLRHPNQHDLTAQLADLASVRHEISVVDDVRVVAVAPDPPAPERGWTRWLSNTMPLAVLAVIIGAACYAFALFYPEPSAGTMWQHLTFQTTKVEATVDFSSEVGECTHVQQPYNTSPRIDVTLSWTQDGQEHTSSYTGCEASVDEPQDIWVTDGGDIASQDSSWADNLVPWIGLAFVPGVVLLGTVYDRVRRRVRRS